jgi:hypothetical protein
MWWLDLRQLQAAEEALHASPEAVVAWARSQAAYQGWGTQRAAKLAREAFPALIVERPGGPPCCPLGRRSSATDRQRRAAGIAWR